MPTTNLAPALEITIAAIPTDLAARRFQQIAGYERRLRILEAEIAEKQGELKDLRDQHAAMLTDIRAAARNQGELELPFDVAAVDDDTIAAGGELEARHDFRRRAAGDVDAGGE